MGMLKHANRSLMVCSNQTKAQKEPHAYHLIMPHLSNVEFELPLMDKTNYTPFATSSSTPLSNTGFYFTCLRPSTISHHYALNTINFVWSMGDNFQTIRKYGIFGVKVDFCFWG